MKKKINFGLKRNYKFLNEKFITHLDQTKEKHYTLALKIEMNYSMLSRIKNRADKADTKDSRWYQLAELLDYPAKEEDIFE